LETAPCSLINSAFAFAGELAGERLAAFSLTIVSLDSRPRLGEEEFRPGISSDEIAYRALIADHELVDFV
jgi:hypothetical protein